MLIREHREKWRNCDQCQLCHTRAEVVTFRRIKTEAFPKQGFACDALIIGESPGEQEDIDGLPFVGPSGNKLREMLTFAVQDIKPIRIGLTNIVCCIPVTNKKIRPPTKAEAAACKDRLIECIREAKPKVVICAGTTAKNFFPGGFVKAKKTFPFIQEIDHILHPSFIIRQVESKIPTVTAEVRLKIKSILEKVFS